MDEEKMKDGFVINTEWVKKLWDACEIQTLVLASLLLQIILTIFGSRRRYYPGIWIRSIVWSCYLMAGWVSTVALGKLTEINNEPISYNVRDPYIKSGVNNALRGLWAPLLLVHYGGPDTITAYSVEDCRLGVRQFLDLAVQIGIVVLILVKSWTNSWLSILTVPLFLAGIIKNGERVWALKSAISGETVIGTSIEKEVKKDFLREPKSYQSFMGKISGLAMLVKAHQRFDRLKPHLENWVGHPLTSIQLPSLRVIDYYPAEDVFKIAEFELAFMYDMLYTKAPINYSRISFCRRIICFLCLVSALTGFSILFKDADLHLVDVTVLISRNYDKNVDIIITYVLLTGAIVLEIYAIWLLLRSDWAILYMMHQNRSRLMKGFLQLVAPKSPTMRPRWSHCMEQLNLLRYCLYEEPRRSGKLISRILKIRGHDEEFKKFRIMNCLQVPTDLKKLILQQMKEARQTRPFFTTPGERTLRKYSCMEEFRRSIQPLFSNTEASKQNNFGRVITLWHIATDVCYHSDDVGYEAINSLKEMSKVISDYMMYLLATRPDMLSVATGNLIFQGVCAQVKAYLEKKPLALREEATVCRVLPGEVAVAEIGKSSDDLRNFITSNWRVMFDVQDLAISLLRKEHRWRIISSIWVELLCHAASNCPWNLHAQQLRRGGELLTHVWLLLDHETDKLNIGFV